MSTRDQTKKYSALIDIARESAQVLRPPERMTVSEAAEKWRYIDNPGSYVGKWDNATAPYLIEPMNSLTRRNLNAVIFCGPAQSGKTELILNWHVYGVMADPADMLFVEKSNTAARDTSRRRVDRLHRHSKPVGERLVARRDADNTFDKTYTSGNMLTLSWPAINELSGRPIMRVALTDYDRMPENIDGEGSPFDLGRKRTTTYRSFGMTLAESSPGFTIEDLKWMPQSRHEAPPCKGILSLYNRGDRQRWYWPCPHCKLYFEGDFDLLTWPDSADTLESAEQAYMRCPHCFTTKGRPITHGMKDELNQQGRWLLDGLRFDDEGNVYGTPFRSDIASFWLKGTAAAFATWKTLVLNYLKAMEEFRRTGSQESLKSTVNTDQGHPYRPQGTEAERLPEALKERAQDIGEKVVPHGVRFLLALADTQKNKWVVQVFGVGVGMDITLIDRFDIVKSKRLDDDGEHLWVKPATYSQDWKLLVDDVLLKTYPLGDDSGRVMSIKLMAVDSGGYAKSKKTTRIGDREAGVTGNAYTFWKSLRNEGKGHHKRLLLLKGESNLAAPRCRVSYPDSSSNSNRHANAKGEVPVLMMNVNVLKDKLNGMLDCLDEGQGLVRFPDWTPDEVYAELTVERRENDGWKNPKSYRNEAWDLFTYCVGLCVHLGVERFNWDKPPSWAEEWDKNTLVSLAIEAVAFVNSPKAEYDLKALAAKLA